MRNVFASSYVLYLSDALFVFLLTWGVLLSATWFSVRLSSFWSRVSVSDVRRFLLFQAYWLMAGLVGFKAVLLSQSVVVPKSILTGPHGSLQFSSAGELVGAVFIVLALFVVSRRVVGSVRRA